jgi:hypothetical protein
LGVVADAYNPSTRDADTGGFRVQGQPGLHSKTVSLKKRKEKK